MNLEKVELKETKEKGVVQIILLLAVLVLTIFLIITTNKPIQKNFVEKIFVAPSPTPVGNYISPTIKKSDAYTIIIVGDSMIDSLGENFDYLRQDLKIYYPGTVFGLFNYGYGSTNVLSLPERLNSETIYRGKINEAILGRALDIIIIGSFGHNPLSQLPLEEGLQKQNQILDSMVLQLVNKKPNTLIVFLADFPPSSKYYGKGVVELTDEQRSAWVNERKAYIENYIKYAQEHNIPLINIYEESQVDGEVNLDYINKDNYIHPSSTGLIFMSQEIADYLYKNNILPN